METGFGAVAAGGLGGGVGGRLTKAGHDVTLIDQWPEHVETMRRRGLRLTGTCGDHTIAVKALHLHEAQSIAEPFDLLFVAVKSYDTEWATRLGVQYLKDDGLVVDFQNGINDHRVAAVAGAHRPLGCVIHLGAEVVRVGRACGFEVEPTFGIAAQRFVDAAEGRGLEAVEAEMVRDATSRAGGRPSMLQDVMRGRRTEIDHLNGFVVGESRRVGVKTPFNEKVVDLYRARGARFVPDPGQLKPLLEMLPSPPGGHK